LVSCSAQTHTPLLRALWFNLSTGQSASASGATIMVQDQPRLNPKASSDFVQPAITPTEYSDAPSLAQLVARQATTLPAGGTVAQGCPGQYSGGVLAGAIVGTFFGTLLILFLWNSLTDTRWRGPRDVVTERKTVRRSRGHRSRSGSGSYSASSVRRPSRVYSVRD
jgi:hypothetical protein